MSNYKVGDTKEVIYGRGPRAVRIANTSTPSECSEDGFSQTACGFVIEFVDIIDSHEMQTSLREDENYNGGGYPSTDMYRYLNEMYNLLPEELRNNIIDTYVVSGYGSNDSANFTTTAKLYLLSTKEVYGSADTYDALSETRQLDYYESIGVTHDNYLAAVKGDDSWWLRSAYSDDSLSYFMVDIDGKSTRGDSLGIGGISPAFRIG